MGVALPGVAGEMDLAHRRQRQARQVGARVEAVVDRADVHVVDVQQQSAAGARDQFAQELRLVDVRGLEAHVGGGVFEQDGLAQALLELVDVGADAAQRRIVVHDGQQVVEIAAIVARPGQVLGDAVGRIAALQLAVPRQQARIERVVPAQRQPDPVHRDGVALAQPRQLRVRGSAGHHVVFGVDLEEPEIGRLFDQRGIVLGLEAQACPGGQAWRRTGRARGHGRDVQDPVLTSLNASSWPKPVGEVGDLVCSHVPFGTCFQALPW
ncbi:Uncharacterised protein [Bordetella pertussis]|nr:Uncharacterised protein [Bordetella pertussis]CRE18506.1 Uncharacterised protein [Bordetella pertussis]CRE29743.1 Uncharacterised protein [Bordetella pertussis]